MEVPSEPRKRVLIADDESGMLRALEYAMAAEGFEAVTASNGTEALRKLYRWQPDLVILDVMMPEMDGWETCRRIREVSDVPIIMLTAKGGEEDIVKGLDAGADDYVIKPFRMAVLQARVRANIRRSSLLSPRTSFGRFIYDGGELIVDMDKRHLIVRGEAVALSATEFRLLSYLIANAERILSSEQLLEHVWGPEYIGETDYVKVYIRYLRQKIEPDPHRPKYILARRGLGYVFNPQSESEKEDGEPI